MRVDSWLCVCVCKIHKAPFTLTRMPAVVLCDVPLTSFHAVHTYTARSVAVTSTILSVPFTAVTRPLDKSRGPPSYSHEMLGGGHPHALQRSSKVWPSTRFFERPIGFTWGNAG